MVNAEVEQISSKTAEFLPEQQAISTLEINDAVLANGAQATFSPRNGFLAYGVQNGEKAKDFHRPPTYIHEVSPKSALYNDYVRKLVNETSGVFLSVNSRMQTLQDDREKRDEIVSTSQRYRAILLVCIEDLHSAIDYGGGDEELTDLMQMFCDIELIWHLLQNLIIETYSASRVVYMLLDWIKWHFVLPEQKREEIIRMDEPEFHDDYWDTIIQLLLQGKIASARSLLKMHSRFDRDDFSSLDELLRKMPMYGATSGVSLETLNEFRIRWKHWHEECKTRLGRGEFSTDENLETVCKILCGDHETLSQKSNLCENWYHLMISVLLYTDPCISISSLGDIARTYYKNVTCPSWSKSSFVDSIILATMELDIMNVIRLACSFNDGWWFVAHIMDLLMHGKFIENTYKDEMIEYRKMLLTNYADTLFAHSSLWQIGVGYLDHCDATQESLELYLERIPLKTEAAAKKVLFLAQRRKMESLVKSVSNVMTRRNLTNGLLGGALSWVKHSKNTRFADEIADRWMKDYAKYREMKGFEIFQNMGSVMLICDKLTFLGKYCEFHNLCSQKELKSAGSLLLSLISSGIAPSNFQVIMLMDALPLLESEELIFSRQDTFTLMKCLEDVVMNCEKTDINNDHESVVRLALVRNLARAFVIQTEDSDDEWW